MDSTPAIAHFRRRVPCATGVGDGNFKQQRSAQSQEFEGDSGAASICLRRTATRLLLQPWWSRPNQKHRSAIRQGTGICLP